MIMERETRMDFAKLTNPGERPVNEDAVGTAACADAMCFVLADGLGGHGGGDAASRAAVETVCAHFAEFGWSESFFEESFALAQREILALQERSRAYGRMKTTLTVLVVTADEAYHAHVGDSRLYLFTRHRQLLRTRDHSVPEMLAMSGTIRESQIRFHPDRNRLVQVLGVEQQPPKPEIGAPIRRKGHQAFLLCSDGFWEWIDEKEMLRTRRSADSCDAWLKDMERTVCRNGQGRDMDNYSAIAVFCGAKD